MARRRRNRSCRGKRRYRDHQEAVRGMRGWWAYQSQRDRLPVRAYFCPHCKGWHLTSQELASP